LPDLPNPPDSLRLAARPPNKSRRKDGTGKDPAGKESAAEA
jgi:hypothetical protein